MAASSDADGDLFVEVNRARQGLKDAEEEDQFEDNCLESTTAVKETKNRYVAEIERLREEVTSLEEQVERDEQSLLQIRMATLDRVQSSLQIVNNSTGIDELTQDHLHRQCSFTGIQYTDATVKIVTQDNQGSIRQHHLEGLCSGLSFQVDYAVKETPLTESSEQCGPVNSSSSSQETRSGITSLSVRIDDRASWELEEFINGIEKDCALQPLLSGYAQYARRAAGRQKAFEHFKTKYQDIVTLPRGPFGPLMEFGRQPADGAVYLITWNISVSATGQSDQQIQLQVKSSKKLRQLDKQRLLKGAPDRFQKMLQRFSIERTIDTFVQAVTT